MRKILYVVAVFVVCGLGWLAFSTNPNLRRTTFNASEAAESPPVVISCSLGNLPDTYRVPEDDAEIFQAVQVAELAIPANMPLRSRLPVLEGIVCDTGNAATVRAFAMDLFIETHAMLSSLDSGESLNGDWESHVTGSTGTVLVLSSNDEPSRLCRVIEYPSISAFMRNDSLVVTARERYCRSDSDWHLDEEIAVGVYPLPERDSEQPVTPEVKPTRPPSIASAGASLHAPEVCCISLLQ